MNRLKPLPLGVPPLQPSSLVAAGHVYSRVFVQTQRKTPCQLAVLKMDRTRGILGQIRNRKITYFLLPGIIASCQDQDLEIPTAVKPYAVAQRIVAECFPQLFVRHSQRAAVHWLR